MTPDYILHGISHANLLLYSAAIPSFDSGSDEKRGNGTKDLDWGGSLDYSNPDNFTHADIPEE